MVNDQQKAELRQITLGHDFGSDVEVVAGIDRHGECHREPAGLIGRWRKGPRRPAFLRRTGSTVSGGDRHVNAKRPALGGALLFFLLLLLRGCVVGPRYSKPSTPAPPEYKEVPPEWKTAQPSDQMMRGKWWEIFQDAQLNALEEQISSFKPESESGAGAV